MCDECIAYLTYIGCLLVVVRVNRHKHHVSLTMSMHAFTTTMNVPSHMAGLGMNREELQKNPILTDYVVQDLNASPVLEFPDNTFDVVTNCVSVDYLTKPLEVFQEVHRVLKPGGLFVNSFSNRCFPTKAIAIWVRNWCAA